MRRFALVAHGGSRPSGRIRSFMQKSGSRISPDTPPAATRGSVMSLRGLFVPQAARSPQLRSGSKEREQLPARRVLKVCDCSSLSPLTLKPLRSPTPCPFTAIATALYVRLRRTRGSAVNGHGYGGCGSWLQRRQPSTMSAGCFPGFDTCGAPPPSRPLRGWLCRQRQDKRRGFASVSAACFLSSCGGGGKVGGVGKSPQRQKHPHQFI